MLLIPGGSYSGIYEGQAEPIALWLNEQGITVFLLRYRLGSAGYRYPAQLQDAVESMRQIRNSAVKRQIDPQRVGVMGFSAGGHLVSTLINRPEDGEIEGHTSTVSPRPDLAILCYPVISFGQYRHTGSMNNLLGPNPPEDLRLSLSNELQVTSRTPPTFLWHTAADAGVPVHEIRDLLGHASLATTDGYLSRRKAGTKDHSGDLKPFAWPADDADFAMKWEVDGKAANYRSVATQIKASGADCIFYGGITQNNAVQLFKDLHAANPDAKRAELVEAYRSEFANPYVAAARGYIDAVIEPETLRSELISRFEVASGRDRSFTERRSPITPA